MNPIILFELLDCIFLTDNQFTDYNVNSFFSIVTSMNNPPQHLIPHHFITVKKESNAH